MRILANLNVAGTLDIDTVANAGVDTDRFLVQDSNGFVKYRTGAELKADCEITPFSRITTNFVATAGQTTFTVSYNPLLVDVFYNGARLSGSEYTATNGTTIVFNIACIDGDIVDVIAYQGEIIGSSVVNGTGVQNEITYWNTTSQISSLSTFIYPNLTELSYVKGVTSSIQSQINGKQAVFGNQNANIVYAGPSDGEAAAPTFRSLVNADFPDSGVTAETYNNSATQVRPFTVNAKGLITGISAGVTITPAWSSITSTPTTIAGYGITDAYTKTEVDSFLQGLDPKASVKAATTGPITLSGTQTIDDVSILSGDRVLVKDQSPQTTNGIYVASASGWSRAADMDADSEFPGAYVFVEQGTANADKGFVCTNNSVSLGSTAITFVQFSGTGAYQPLLNGTGFVRMDGTTLSYITGTANEIIAANGSKITAGTNITISGGIISATDVGFANPMTTLGDIIYGGASGSAVRLAGNTSTAKKFLIQTGNGTISAAPSWGTISGSDVSFGNQNANTIFAGPASGTAAAPTFRALVSADIPNNAANTTGSAAKLTTGRTLKIGETGQTFDGSTDKTWTLAEIGALSSSTSSTQSGYFGDIYLYDDSTPSHYLAITNSANLTAGRTLSINVNDANRTISLDGNLTVSAAATISGTNTGDQTNISGNAATATKLETKRAINGVDFDGSAAITITANTGTSLTFNNGGGGAASGTTFNGSVARTISYNTIGAPKTDGTDATGTWPIDIAGTVSKAIAANSDSNWLYGNMATNDYFRIRAGGAANAGYLEIATADDGTEPIYIRQYNGLFGTIARTATILDGSGNTSFPGTLTASNFSGSSSGTNTGDQTDISGNAATATISSTVTINSSAAADWYDLVWRSGNTLYRSSGTGGNGGIQVYPSGNYIRCQYINTTDNDESGITRFVIKNGDAYHRSATTTVAADIIRGVASGTWGINISGNAATATTATSATSATTATSATSASYATYLTSSNYIVQKGSTGSWNADFQNTPAGATSYGGDVGANTTNNPQGTWWMQQNFRHNNASNYWGVQVAWGWEDNANKLFTRNVINGSFGGWVEYLNTNNFPAYGLTLGGSQMISGQKIFNGVTGKPLFMGNESGWLAFINTNGNAEWDFTAVGTIENYTFQINESNVDTPGVGSARFRLFAGGGCNIFGAVSASGGFFDTSDVRFKNVIEKNPLVNLDSIDVIKFVFKYDEKHNQVRYGYSAQQIQGIMPELIFRNEGDDRMHINYSDVHTIKIKALENRVKELELKLGI